MTPRTFAHVAFATEDCITLQRGDEFFEVRDVVDPDTFWAVRRVAVGVLTLQEAADLTGLPLADLESGFAILQDCGLAYKPSLVDLPTDLPAASVGAAIRRYGDMWREHLFRDPVFAPEQPAPLMWFGFLVENYHRAKALPEILARGRRSAASDRAVAAAFDRLCEEEEDHAHYYATALSAFPLVPERILHNSTPLLSTRALCWFLTELAEQRPLSFLGTCRLTEAQAGDDVFFTDEARALSAGYGVPEAAVSPVLDHGLLDAGASHKLLIDEVIASRPTWPRTQIDQLMQDMHDFRHAYGGFLSGLRDHYGGPSDSIPNRVFRWSDFGP